MDMKQEIGVLQEQGRWLASKAEKMDAKLDELLLSHNFLKWKVTAITAGVSVITAGLFELCLALVRH